MTDKCITCGDIKTIKDAFKHADNHLKSVSRQSAPTVTIIDCDKEGMDAGEVWSMLKSNELPIPQKETDIILEFLEIKLLIRNWRDYKWQHLNT